MIKTFTTPISQINNTLFENVNNSTSVCENCTITENYYIYSNNKLVKYIIT